MVRALVAAFAVLHCASLARAQAVCVPPLARVCAPLPLPQTVPRVRPSSAQRPSPGAPAFEAAQALDRVWRLAEGLPTEPPRDLPRIRDVRAALLALVESHPRLDDLDLGDLRAEWPTEYAIHFAIAELSWQLDDLDACAARYEELLRRYPAADDRDHSAYTALLCRHRQHERGRERAGRGMRDALGPRTLTEPETRFVAAVDRYLCMSPRSADATDAAYRAARVHYEANRHEEAASRFRAIAEGSPTHELAEYAANLYLDCVNLLSFDRPECSTELGAAVARLGPLYCRTRADRVAHDDLCSTLSALRCDLGRREAEGLSTASRHDLARDRYLEIARAERHCGRIDEVLFNAAAEADEAHDTTGAERIRRLLRRTFPESHLAR